MILENHNLKIRLFENANIGQLHHKFAIGFTFIRDDKNDREVYAVSGADGNTLFKYGDGHIRIVVSLFLKKELGCDHPAFSEIWEWCRAFETTPVIKGFILR